MLGSALGLQVPARQLLGLLPCTGANSTQEPRRQLQPPLAAPLQPGRRDLPQSLRPSSARESKSLRTTSHDGGGTPGRRRTTARCLNQHTHATHTPYTHSHTHHTHNTHTHTHTHTYTHTPMGLLAGTALHYHDFGHVRRILRLHLGPSFLAG